MNAALRGLPVLPFDTRPAVNAGDTAVADFTWLNADQEPEAPVSLRYRIDNLTDYRNVLGWNVITPPAATTQITITAAQNVMGQTWRDRQWMQVTVEATMTGGAVLKKLWVYELIAQINP